MLKIVSAYDLKQDLGHIMLKIVSDGTGMTNLAHNIQK